VIVKAENDILIPFPVKKEKETATASIRLILKAYLSKYIATKYKHKWAKTSLFS